MLRFYSEFTRKMYHTAPRPKSATLQTARDPNGRVNLGLRPHVRSATQTGQNERPSASVWVGRLEMPLPPTGGGVKATPGDLLQRSARLGWQRPSLVSGSETRRLHTPHVLAKS
jgi:hypothetical protein